MRKLVYTHTLAGRLIAVGPGVLDASLAGTDEPATIAAQLSFADERSFELTGEIHLGEDRGTVRVRTLGYGRLDPSPEPGLLLGTAMLEICGGTGQFDGAHGRITSNFVVRDGLEITDHQLGVVFVAVPSKEES